MSIKIKVVEIGERFAATDRGLLVAGIVFKIRRSFFSDLIDDFPPRCQWRECVQLN